MKIRSTASITLLFLFIVSTCFYFNSNLLTMPLVCANEVFQRTQPEVLWEKTFGGPGDDRGVGTVYCPQEECFFSVGTTIAISQLNSSIYIVKSDREGNVLWERNYGSHSNNSAASILINHHQEIIVSSNVMNVNEQSEPNNISIMRLDYHGKLLEEIILHSNRQQYVSMILQMPDHSYVLFGSIYDETEQIDEVYLLKLSPLFEIEWQKTIASEALLTAHDLVITSDGYLVLSTMLDSRGQMRILIQKLDYEGNTLWSNRYGSKQNYMGSALIKTYDNHYLVMGETDAYGDEVGVILFKIDQEGNKIWEKFHRMKTSTIGRSIIETCNQGFLIAGATNISIDDILYSSGEAKGYLLFVDSYGNMLWERTFGGSRHNFLLHLLKLPDNSYVLTGRSSSFSKGRDMDLYMLHLSPFVYDKPLMSIYPEKLYFGVLEKNSFSPLRMVYISNDGLGNLNGYITANDPWISTTDSSFIIPTYGFLALPVSVNAKTLHEGNYSGKITLQTNGGVAEIEIFVDIIDNAPSLSVEPSYVDFGILKSREPLSHVFNISNKGRQNLFGSIQCSQAWISTSQDRFVANQISLEIGLDPSSLRNGRHQAELTIQSNGGDIIIPIHLECQFPVLTLILTIGKSEALLNGEIVSIDSNNSHVVPLIRQGRTLVPLRFLAEIFGAQVAWNPDLKTIHLENTSKKISLWLQVNNNQAKINEKTINLDVPPMIIEDRVFMPLRFLAESFNAEISIDQSDPLQAMKIIIKYEQ